MKKNQQKIPIIFSSDDSEGVNISYNSSEEEQNENDEKEISKNVQLLKDKMHHFFLENPEFKENMVFEPFNVEQVAENNLKRRKSSYNPYETHSSSILKFKQTAPRSNSQNTNEAENKAKYSPFWGKVADGLLKESKRKENKNLLAPSIEYINNRLNLYRQKIETPDVFEVLEAEAKRTNNFQQKKNKTDTNQNLIEKKLKEQLIKQAGDVKEYFSLKKQLQFKSRFKKAKKNIEESEKKKEKEKQDVLTRLFPDNRKNSVADANEDENLENRKFNSKEGENLYLALKKCPDNNSIKRTALEFFNKYKKEAIENFDFKNSVLNQTPKFLTDESKEFNLYFPDFNYAKNLTPEEIEKIIEKPEVFSKEDGNVFLLKKMKKIMKSNIINYWKHLQDPQKN